MMPGSKTSSSSGIRTVATILPPPPSSAWPTAPLPRIRPKVVPFWRSRSATSTTPVCAVGLTALPSRPICNGRYPNGLLQDNRADRGDGSRAGDSGGSAARLARMRAAVIGSTGGWHAERLERAFTSRGHECAFAPVTRMVGRIADGFRVCSREVALDQCDVVVVRAIPRGSLQQIVFRVDALHALAAVGVRPVNRALAIEHSIDKFLCSALLAAAGLPTPRTVACERAGDALVAFDELGSDVIVKPLFGSMGFGMARVEDRDVAQRVFRALEIERAVYYLQETIPHDGVDVRAVVVGTSVVAAIERVGEGWRANLARGARARPIALDEERAALCVRAAAALGADYAGVDLLRSADGRDYVLEVNAIPGWHGVEAATGVDVAGALVAHLEASG